MEKRDPLVTVLMPVYNGGEYLRPSIESILRQAYRDFEFLIINDCSTDHSLETIYSFRDPRITVHNNEINLGQTKSLNVGLKLAKGKYIARMDADDMAFPMWLDKLVKYILEHPEYVAVSSYAAVIDGLGNPQRILRTPINFQEVIVNLFFGKAMNHVGALFKKEIILGIGGYNEDFCVAQDYELWSSLIRTGYQIINIPDILVSVRVHENSFGFIEENKKGLQDVVETITRTVNTLTSLKITRDEAVKIRLFYRLPSYLASNDFKWVQNMYEKIFDNLKDKFKLNPKLLRKRLKIQMLRPYCIRAVHEIEGNKLSAAREILKDYFRSYGFHIMPFCLYLVTYTGFGVAKKLPLIYEESLKIVTKLFLIIRVHQKTTV